jgi:hypothetical protein
MLCYTNDPDKWHPPWPKDQPGTFIDFTCATPEEGVKFVSWMHVRKAYGADVIGCKACAFAGIEQRRKCTTYDCNNGTYLGPTTRVLLRMGAL